MDYHLRMNVEFRDENVPLSEEQKLNRKQILTQVTTQPETFGMDVWDTEAFPYDVEGCGSTRCIAGWALFFAGVSTRDLMVRGNVLLTDVKITQEAVRVMGLSEGEYYRANSAGLFHLYSEEDAVEQLRELTVE
jgi:hypothetical protein